MAPWGEMHEELKKDKMTHIPKTEECTIKLFKKMESTIVNKKIKKIGNKKMMLLEDYVLRLLIEHNYRLLGKDGSINYQHISS